MRPFPFQADPGDAYPPMTGVVQKLTRMRAGLGISCIMVGEVGGVAPLVERLAGS